MKFDETRAFDDWLDRANQELVASVGARLNVEAALKEVTLRGDKPDIPLRLPIIAKSVEHDDVPAALTGDRRAVERLLASIRPLVVRYCRARVETRKRSLVSADDVAQDVCLAVLTALPSYRDQGRPFLAFVYGIAAHKVADAHRSAAKNRSEAVPEVPDVLETEAGPEQRAMQSELSDQLVVLLQILPEKQREILLLRVVVGLSAEETAEAVGSTPGAVRVAQHRALSRLRKKLSGDDQNAGSTWWYVRADERQA